jgi:hypothetical protein
LEAQEKALDRQAGIGYNRPSLFGSTEQRQKKRQPGRKNWLTGWLVVGKFIFRLNGGGCRNRVFEN